MTTATFVLIAVLAVLMVICCVLLIVMELHQAAKARATAERHMLQTKLELRRLRKEVKRTVR